MYLNRCYDEHEVPRSCNTTIYLSALIIVFSRIGLFRCYEHEMVICFMIKGISNKLVVNMSPLTGLGNHI